MSEVLKKKFDVFAALANKHAHRYPWMVVITMHEYFRNIFPSDPYLPFPKRISPVKRISDILDNNIALLSHADHLGSYYSSNRKTLETVVEKYKDDKRKAEQPVTQVYGTLWDKFDVGMYLKETSKIVLERFQHSGFYFASLRGKVILDLGCGSGRFTIALSHLTKAKKVYGIDLGEQSMNRARLICKQAGIRNVEYRVADVLNIPFKDGYFDFVFCNGVLHHTKNMEKGIEEMYRVLKPGSMAFLYLYGDGGLFWYSRKKMPVIMKKIPQAYTVEMLHLLGMPSNRFLFSDNWYVPIERHTTVSYLEKFLRKTGFVNMQKIMSGRSTDLERAAKADPILWGEGELRYLLTK